MKQFFLLLTVLLTINCSNFYAPQKVKTIKTATFEAGDKDAGIVQLSFTYRPMNEIPTVDFYSSEKNAIDICKRWGFEGANLQKSDRYLSKCVQFDFNTGNCLLYKTDIGAYCY